MKLGLVTTSFPREPGDPAGSFVGSHARWLRAAGHEIDVIAAGDGSGRGYEQRGAEVVRVASRLFYRGGAPEALEGGGVVALARAAGFSLRQLAAVRRRLGQWDAVCAHWLAPSGLAVAALLASSRRSLPFLAIAHSGDVHWLERLRMTRTAARLLSRANARLTFSSGPLAQRFFDRAGASATTLEPASIVTPMGVELVGPGPHKRRSKVMRLAFVGRLVPIKGVDVLLEALARLDDNVDLVIAGDGPARQDLERQAQRLGLEGRARFLGEVRGPARDHLLSAADLVVIPSQPQGDGRTEGMPVVVLEAIAAGTPVVVSRTGGMTELPASVPKVTPGDVAALVAAIERLRPAASREELRQRQYPIAEAQRWERVGAVLWRHWRADPLVATACRTA